MPSTAPIPTDVDQAITTACDHIAPSWPLDRMIAVNPLWGFVDAPIEQAAAEVSALSGATLLMPRAWYREQYAAGRFNERHVAQAITITGASRQAGEVLATMQRDEPAAAHWLLMTDAADAGRDLGHGMPWAEYVTRHISQTCAAYFDEGQARWTPDRADGLYPLWRELGVHDGGPRLLMGLHGFREAVATLPVDPRALIAQALEELEVRSEFRAQYLTALLLSVNGWASVCAFQRWEARLAAGDDDQIVHLLAVRLAWELLLLRLGHPSAAAAWRSAKGSWASIAPRVQDDQRDDWLLQRACEIAYQEQVTGALTTAMRAPTPLHPQPTAHAVFCIDVRSEVFRRSLERVAPSVRTMGFAGFFGLPIAYQPLSGPTRAQLPGLLAPAMIVEDAGADRSAARAATRQNYGDSALISSLGSTAGSAFSFVEATGIAAAAKLIRDGFGLGAGAGDTLRTSADAHRTLRPELTHRADGSAVPLDARVNLAKGILGAMSLTSGYAPLLALIGHGASTENNPLAAGLHCGACGGQTGELNARALAALLNDADVRAGLLAAGIDLGGTHVVAGLHDTTTDEIRLYDLDRVPASHTPLLQSLRTQFAEAGVGARRERAESLGLAAASDGALETSIRHRSRDWAEVRPEWGLAGNAAFIVAPRERTASIDLQGRSFLHEYRWQQDTTFGVLELILTAPMVVTHWINLQYYASVVDPLRYGSGNKVLHNVVGGRIGVMEGAGGDLRIGLAMQSVHDGQRWMHEPLRLSVFVEAPAAAIDDIIAKHATVRHLVEHGWLFLHRIDSESGEITQRRRGGWFAIERSSYRQKYHTVCDEPLRGSSSHESPPGKTVPRLRLHRCHDTQAAIAQEERGQIFAR
ncbi:MAG: DUF2309 domain-containing protein [Gemmatimonadaceae bacterium]|nr:DUF2309 domain-containing protein [Gemmatimonadaceae bacterium]